MAIELRQICFKFLERGVVEDEAVTRFVIFELEIALIGGREIEVIKAIFSGGKGGAAIVVAGADEDFHEGIDDEGVAQPLEKIGGAPRVVSEEVPRVARFPREGDIFGEREMGVELFLQVVFEGGRVAEGVEIAGVVGVVGIDGRDVA